MNNPNRTRQLIRAIIKENLELTSNPSVAITDLPIGTLGKQLLIPMKGECDPSKIPTGKIAIKNNKRLNKTIGVFWTSTLKYENSNPTSRRH